MSVTIEQTHIKHPCYNPELAMQIGRLHLPIASECNMQCNYCNKNFSCPNENRPAVCTKILQPAEILDFVEDALNKCPKIGIVGIAGPAEPLANIDSLYYSYKLIKHHYPKLKLCLATNGLVFADNIDIIKELAIDFVTITINSLNIEELNQIYDWVKYDNHYYKGEEASRIIQQQQLKALELLSSNKIKFKINSIFIPSINEESLVKIAQSGLKYGASAYNIIPMIHLEGSKFATKEPVAPGKLHKAREECSRYLPIIKHCRLCRSDAAGLIGQ